MIRNNCSLCYRRLLRQARFTGVNFQNVHRVYFFYKKKEWRWSPAFSIPSCRPEKFSNQAKPKNVHLPYASLLHADRCNCSLSFPFLLNEIVSRTAVLHSTSATNIRIDCTHDLKIKLEDMKDLPSVSWTPFLSQFQFIFPQNSFNILCVIIKKVCVYP